MISVVMQRQPSYSAKSGVSSIPEHLRFIVGAPEYWITRLRG
jgi:hypothetical protein